MSNRIFVDTSYIVALFVSKDQYNNQAKNLIPKINKKEKVICQSVINEAITLINKKEGIEKSKLAYKLMLDYFTIITEDMGLYTDSMDILIK